jgi:hypothetical protein
MGTAATVILPHLGTDVCDCGRSFSLQGQQESALLLCASLQLQGRTSARTVASWFSSSTTRARNNTAS